MSKELTTTINIDKEDYNINAEKANKVANALIIKSIGLNGTAASKTFNGSSEVTISVVDANTGGKFKKEIRVPNNKETNWENWHDETVLNYSDIKNKLLENILNNSTLYEWNGSWPESWTQTEGIFKSISIVTGKNADVGSFASTNYQKKKFQAYIYIANDDDGAGMIYFGTSKSNEPVGVKVSADSAVKATNADNAKKIVSSDGKSSYTYANLKTKITTLDSINTVINTAKLDNTSADRLSKILADTNTSYSGDNVVFKNANHAVSADSATSATKAKQDTNGKSIHYNYYRTNSTGSSTAKVITLSTDKPSGGNNGDIWIKY